MKKKNKKNPQVPYHKKPEDMNLEDWQIELRKQFAKTQKFKIRNMNGHPVYSDFEVFNPQTKKKYKVAIRSKSPGYNYCSCPDFKTNVLGTCKHIEATLNKLNRNRSNINLFEQPYQRPYSSVTLKYGLDPKIVLRIGTTGTEQLSALAKKYFDKNSELLPMGFDLFEKFLQDACQIDPSFRCYEDALTFIAEIRDKNKKLCHLKSLFPKEIPDDYLSQIIRVPLYPYQKEGVTFAAISGRCVIADDMGLGKTLQAIVMSEIYIKEFGISDILIVCPTSLKYQWKSEIEKFTHHNAHVIEGLMLERQKQYKIQCPYKIISYNAIVNDTEYLKDHDFDLIILDEAQRIKNWKAKTSQNIKKLKSTSALVLTGTPLENRIDELHSIVQFVDRFKLGPLYRFLYQHQIHQTGSTKVVGYRELNRIGEALRDVLIRRNKKEVLTQLPPRIDNNYFVEVTPEQMEVHDENKEIVSRLVTKWKRTGFLSEPERQRLLIALNRMRMVCDSTYILDQETRYDTKINELMLLLKDIFEKDEKVLIFSQWERMTRLVANELNKKKIRYEYLHGGIPSIKRKSLMDNFKSDPLCKVFLSTDAGGLGLNLQSASTVINLDIPWNPAVLEQRIGRAHRLGQHKTVQVINFVSEGTIEHKMLDVLKFKMSIFNGVLENGEDMVFVKNDKLKEYMELISTVTQNPTDTNVVVKTETPVETVVPKPVIDFPVIPAVDETTVVTNKSGNEPSENVHHALQQLLQTGIQFLQKLNTDFSAQHRLQDDQNKQAQNNIIYKDPSTGQNYLNIPVPDDKFIGNLVGMFNQLVMKK